LNPSKTPLLLDIAHLTVTTGISARNAALFLPVLEMDHKISYIEGIVLCKLVDLIGDPDQIL